MSEAKVTFTADAAQAAKEIERLEKAQERLEKKLIETARISKREAQEFARIQRDVVAALEKSRSPAEAYAAQLKKMKQALSEGLLTEAQFLKLRDIELAKLNAITKATRESSAAYREEAAAKKAAAEAEQKDKNIASALKLAEIRRSELAALEKRKRLAAENTALDQRAAQVTEANLSPLARYNRTLSELDNLYRRKKISLDAYNVAAARARNELRMSQGSADRAGGAIGALGARALAAVGGISALTMAIRGGIAENQKYQESTEANILKLDEQERKFAIAAGLQGLQSKEARNRIMNVAHANAVTTEQAFAAATQLESAGFAAPQQTGTLDAFLKIMASGGLKDADPAASVESMAKFMESFGMDKSQANMLDMGVRMRGLKDTLVQVSDLSEFSKAAPVFSGSGVSVQDTLSTLTILRDTMSAGEAATGGRNIVQSLASAGATRTGKDALGELGLDISDVDLVGETLVEALGRVKAARDMLPEEQRATVMTRLFQRENVAAANIVMDNLDKFQSLGAAQGDRGSFVQGVQVAQSGLNADMNRLDVMEQMTAASREEEATRRALAKKEINIVRSEQYAQGNVIQDAFSFVGNRVVDAGIGTGLVSRESQTAGLTNNPANMQFNEKMLERMLNVNEQQLAAQRQGNRDAAKKPAMNPTALNNAPR